MRCPSCGRESIETARFCPDCGAAIGSSSRAECGFERTVPTARAGAALSFPARIGKFEIRGELGRGAMGIVYDGWDPVIDRRVAIKTVRRSQFEGGEVEEIMARFRREAQAAGRLSHPNVVAVHDYGEADGIAFIAMEFIEGRSLKACMDAGERFPLREIVRIMAQILDALDYSHRRGVVHRDIKPANIVLPGDGTVKVTDFGVARVESSTLTQVGTVVGTPLYMSPEQYMGTTVDGRSDIFSAGVVLYQLLTGERPFTGAAVTTIMHKVLFETPPPPSKLNVQVPVPFDEIVAKSLAKRPEERYQSARAFVEALEAAMSLPAPAEAAAVAAADQPAPTPPVASSGTSRMRSPALLALLSGIALAGVGASVWLWLNERTPEPAAIPAPAVQQPVSPAAPIAGPAPTPALKPPPEAPVTVDTKHAPPPRAAAEARAPAHEPAKASGSPNWRQQLRVEIDNCRQFGFPRQVFCTERARWKYCAPDRWNAVPECSQPRE